MVVKNCFKKFLSILRKFKISLLTCVVKHIKYQIYVTFRSTVPHGLTRTGVKQGSRLLINRLPIYDAIVFTKYTLE